MLLSRGIKISSIPIVHVLFINFSIHFEMKNTKKERRVKQGQKWKQGQKHSL